MTHEPRVITITDPRTFDGDPYEVAERACLQASALAGILAEALDPVRLMVRNAELERQLQTHERANAELWESGPQARTLATAQDDLLLLQKRLDTLGRAAGFNPKAAK